jgi:hypothetical protein
VVRTTPYLLSFLLYYSPAYCWVIKMSMSLKYEPASELPVIEMARKTLKGSEDFYLQDKASIWP